MRFAGILATGLLMVLACCLVTGVVAREFSAQMLLRQGDKIMPGKIYVKDGKMRQEFVDEQGQSITIVRPDKKVIWVILPQTRQYTEIPSGGKLPGQFLEVPPDAISKRKVGTETVNGYVSDKLEVMVRGGQGVVRQTFWVSQKLGSPVKMTCKDRNLCVEYRDIKESRVAERLFELPPGYQKVNPPSGKPLERWD